MKELKDAPHTFTEMHGPEARDLSHCEVLDGYFEEAPLSSERMIEQSLALTAKFSVEWEQQACTLCELIESAQPQGWALEKETLFHSDAMRLALLKNKEGYERMGAFCMEAKRFSEAIKPLRTLGPRSAFVPHLVSPAVSKRLKELIRDGIEMVCFTFGVFYISREIPMHLSVEKVASAADVVRKKFSTHNVPLTTHMEEILSGLASGLVAANHYMLRVEDSEISPTKAVAATPAPGPVSPAPVSASESSGPPGGAPAAPDGGAAPPAKRARLADRLRSRAVA